MPTPLTVKANERGLLLSLNGILTVYARSDVGVNVACTCTRAPGASVPCAGSHTKKFQSLACSSGRLTAHSAGISLGLYTESVIERVMPSCTLPKSSVSAESCSSGSVMLARMTITIGGPAFMSSFARKTNSPSPTLPDLEANVTAKSTLSDSGSPGSRTTLSGSMRKPPERSAFLSRSNEIACQPTLRTRKVFFLVEPLTTLPKSSR